MKSSSNNTYFVREIHCWGNSQLRKFTVEEIHCWGNSLWRIFLGTPKRIPQWIENAIPKSMHLYFASIFVQKVLQNWLLAVFEYTVSIPKIPNTWCMLISTYILRAGSCASELQLKVNCRLKFFWLVCQL